jgi:hypothetical protein
MSTSSGSSAASSSASDEQDPEEFERTDQRMRAIALGAGVAPASVPRVLDHYAKTLQKHVDAGDVDPDELTDAHHAEHIRRIVASNPETHVHYRPPEPTGPHADHEGDSRAPSPPAGKTFKPGQKNTATRAEMRKRGVTY